MRYKRRVKAWFSISFFFQAEDGIRYLTVTGVQTCALPISAILMGPCIISIVHVARACVSASSPSKLSRSEEHTSELQSQSNLVCRLLLEKKKSKAEQRHVLAPP